MQRQTAAAPPPSAAWLTTAGGDRSPAHARGTCEAVIHTGTLQLHGWCGRRACSLPAPPGKASSLAAPAADVVQIPEDARLVRFCTGPAAPLHRRCTRRRKRAGCRAEDGGGRQATQLGSHHCWITFYSSMVLYSACGSRTCRPEAGHLSCSTKRPNPGTGPCAPPLLHRSYSVPTCALRTVTARRFKPGRAGACRASNILKTRHSGAFQAAPYRCGRVMQAQEDAQLHMSAWHACRTVQRWVQRWAHPACRASLPW